MKRFFKKLGKGCGYVVLYLLVAVGTAVGILFLSPAGNTNVSANEIPVQLKQLWENLQAENALDINVDAAIETNSKNISISVDAKLDLSNGFDKLKVSGKVGLDSQDNKLDINLFYGDGKIYVEALNGKFVMKTSSIGDSLGKITNVLGLSLPSLGGIDLSSLDANMILGFLSDLQEIKGKDGTKLAINISMIEPAIKLNVLCDNDYNLQSIELPETSISGTTFAVDATIERPEKLTLIAPSDEDYIDVSDLVDVAGVVLKTLGQDTLGFDLKVKTGDFALEGTLSADIKNLNAMFETTLLDMPLKVAVFKDSFCYLEYGSIYLKFALSDTEKLTDFLAKHFDINVPIEQVAELLSAIQGGNLMAVLPALSFGMQAPSVDEIDLSILESLERNDQTFTISLRDIGKIDVVSEKDALKALSFNSDFLSIQIDIIEPKEVQISEIEHADFGKLLPALDALLDTVKQDKIAGKAHITYGEVSADADFKVSLQDKTLQVSAQANAFGSSASLNYQQDKLFVDYSGLKIVGEKDDIDYILNLFDLKPASSNSVETLLGLLKKIVDPQSGRSLISIQSKEGAAEIGIVDKAKITLRYDELLKSIKVSVGELEAVVDLTAQVSFPEISADEYVSVRDVANKIHKVLDYVNEKKFYVTFDGKYQDFSLSGKVNFDENGLQAEVDVFAFGQDVKLRVLDETIFLDVKDLHVKVPLENGKEIVGLLSKEFGIDVQALLEKLRSSEKEIDITQILSKLWLAYQNDNLTIKFDGVEASVVFEDDMLSFADVAYADLTAHVEISDKNAITPIGDVEYTDVSDILRKAGKVYDYVQGGKYYGTVLLTYDDLVTVSGFVGYDTDGLQAELDVAAYGQTAKIRVLGTEIFVDFKDLHISADISKWQDIVGLLSAGFGLDVEKLKAEMPDLKEFDLEGLLAKLELGYADDTLTAEYAGAQVSVVFEDDMLSYADVAYAKLSAHLALGEKQTLTAFDGKISYTDIEELLNKAIWLYDYVKGGEYYATIEATYGDLAKVTGYVGFDEDGLQAELDVAAYGQTAKIRVLGTKVYLDFKGLHISADLADWKNLLSVVSREFGIDFNEMLGEFGLDLDKLEEILSGKQKVDATKLVGSEDVDIAGILKELGLGYAEDVLIITYQDVSVTVAFEGDALKGVAFGYGEQLSGGITLGSRKTITQVDEADEYYDAADLIAKAGMIYRYVKAGKFYFEVSGGYDDLLTFNGFVNYDDSLKAEIDIEAYGQTAKVRVLGTNVYLDVKDLHITADILNWKKIVEALEDSFGLDLSAITENLEQNGDMQKTIEDLLKKLGLGYDKEGLKISISGADVVVKFEENDNFSADVTFEGLKATLTKVTWQGDFTDIEDAECYVPVEDLIAKAGNVYDYVMNKQYYFDIEANVDDKATIFATLNFDGENGLSAEISTVVSGVSISAKLLGGTIYLRLANLRLKFNLNEIPTVLNFLKVQFGLDFVDEYNQYEWLIKALTEDKDIKFSDFSKLGTGEEVDIAALLEKLGLSMTGGDILNVTLSQPNLTAAATFADNDLSSISLQIDTISAKIDVLKKAKAIELAKGEYFSLVDILPVFTSIKSYVLGKQYDITANAQVLEGGTKIYDAQGIVLQVDATKELQFYADAHVAGVADTKSAGFDLRLNASIFNDYLYVDYNNLCLKLGTQDLQGVLGVLCEMIGVDPSILSFITGKESESSGIDISDFDGVLSQVMPGVDTNNKLGLLNIIKEFSMEGSTFDITLDGSKVVSDSEGAENMHLKIVLSAGDKLEEIALQNLYTGVTADEHFNLEVFFGEFKEMKSPDLTKNYVDLSGAEDLIVALLNTITHQTFELTGKLNVKINIPVIDKIEWNIPVSIQVKISNGKPEVYAQVGEIPVVDIKVLGIRVYNLNNDTGLNGPNGDRKLYIYYKDGMVYFYRDETTKDGKYEKRIISSLDTVMNDVLYYVEWGTGFNKDVMAAIRKSLSIEHTVDLGNVIKGFAKPTASNPHYEITLNMTEISGDKNMGDMTVGIGLGTFKKQVDEENFVSQSVVGNLTFGLNMPFADAISLDLQSSNEDNTQNLYLALDKNFDEQFEQYKQSYAEAKDDKGKPFLPDIPYYAQGGEWGSENEREFTVTFETGRSELTKDPVKGTKGTTFDLPNYTETFVDDYVNPATGVQDGKTKYRFGGWYTDQNFATGSEFVEGVIRNYNFTVYGKWETVKEETWRTVYYYDGEELKTTQYDLIGTELRQDIENMGIRRKKNESDGFAYAVEFDGWQDASGGMHTVIPDYSIVLYPHYKADESLRKYTLTFETGFGPVLHEMEFYGNTKDIRGQTNAFDRYGNVEYGENIYKASEDYTYKFEGWFFDPDFTQPFDFAMPASDLTIYAKWTEIMEWKFQIYDNGVGLLHGEDGGDLYLKKGTKIVPYSADAQVGENEFMLPQSVRIKTDVDLQGEGDSATEWYFGYDNGAYSDKTVLPDKMTNHDLELHIRNKYHVQYTYYELENITERYNVTNPDYEIVIATLPATQNRTFDAYLWQNEKFDLKQADFYIDAYKSGKTLGTRTEYKFKYSNGLTGKTATVANHDMIFTSEIDQTTTKTRTWHYISFDVTFEKPVDWRVDSWISKDSDATAPESVAVLDGDKFTPPDGSNVKAVYKYGFGKLVATYTFHVLGWIVGDNCANASNGLDNIYSNQYTYYSGAEPVSGDIVLRAVWGR